MLLSVLRYVCLEKLFCFTFSCCCSLIFMFYLFTQLCWVVAPRPGMEPGPAASRAESQPLDQTRKSLFVVLFCFVFLNNNSFIEILSIHLTIYPLPVYTSVVSSIFRVVPAITTVHLKDFHRPQKHSRSCQLPLNPSSLPCALLAPPRGHSVLRPALSSSDATQRLSGSTGADRSATALPRLRHSRAAWGILGPRPARRSSLMGEFRLHLKLLTYKQYNCQ